MNVIAAAANKSQESEYLVELRRAFDQTFAVAPAAEPEAFERLIEIRVAGQPFLLRTEQATGLFKAERIVPVPSRISELLGIAALRGVLIPVFSLARFLEILPRVETARWIVLAKCEPPAALAFDEVEGRVEVDPACMYTDKSSASLPYVGLLARVGPTTRPVIDIPAIMDAIQKELVSTDQSRSKSP